MAPWMMRQSLLERLSLYGGMLLIGFVMIFPFAYVVAVSFSSYQDVAAGGLIIFPAHPTLESYTWVLRNGSVMQGFLNSVFLATVGTAFNMFMTVTMAYALSRTQVFGIKTSLWLVLLTLLIAPTIITKYLLIKELHMLNTIWALIIPGAIGPFNLLVLRQFFLNIPRELIESAKMDGANDLRILWTIVLPLSKASLAVIALFYAVGHWNSFFDAVLYIHNSELYPLSVVLRAIIQQGNLPMDATPQGDVPPPDITMQMAVVVLATLPILLIYPFLQKYFTKGVLTGSIKG